MKAFLRVLLAWVSMILLSRGDKDWAKRTLDLKELVLPLIRAKQCGGNMVPVLN